MLFIHEFSHKCWQLFLLLPTAVAVDEHVCYWRRQVAQIDVVWAVMNVCSRRVRCCLRHGVA